LLSATTTPTQTTQTTQTDDDDDGGAGDGKMKKETSAPVAAAAHESKVPRGDEIVVVPVTFVKDVLLLSDSEFKAAFNTVQKLQGRAVVDEAIAAVVAADAATKPTTQAPTPPQALPKGWRQYSTKDGSRTYYHNSVTHVTQWTRPVADEATSAASTSSQTSRATLLSQIAAGTTLKHVKTRMSGGRRHGA
jgi:hypothetical protein